MRQGWVVLFGSLGVVSCNGDETSSEFPASQGGSGGSTVVGTGGVRIDGSIDSGSAGTGGSSGSGGASASGGQAGGVAGLGGGASVIEGHDCARAIPGATGNEPDGLIPVCCTPATAEKALIDEMFALLNAHRQSAGVSALAYDDDLEASAQGHSIHMVLHPFFENDAPETAVATISTRASICGATAYGENVAMGNSDPQAVMNLLAGDPGSNDNMIKDSFSRVGIGTYNDHWTQLFGQ